MSAADSDISCRTCLAITNKLYSLWQKIQVLNGSESLKDVLTECTSVVVNEDDGLPSGMCEKCVEKLIQCYEFRTLCRECDQKLHCCVAKNVDHSYCKAAPEKVVKNADILEDLSTETTTVEHLIADLNTVEHLPPKISSVQLTESDPEPETSNNVQESYTCTNVSYTKHKFIPHTKPHKDNDELICRVCDKQFTRAFDARRHMTLHTGHKPYTCNICSASFTQSGSLACHKRKHAEFKDTPKATKRENIEKPYLCSICGLSFRDSSSLTVHTRQHTGEKPYECKNCGMSLGNFLTSCAVCEENNGEGVVDENPVARVAKTVTVTSVTCKTCEIAFSKVSDLYIHTIKEHPAKQCKPITLPPTKCDICKIKFSRASNLRKHLRLKHPEKLNIIFPKRKYAAVVTCKDCNKSFVNRSNLSKHMKTKHIDSVTLVSREEGTNRYQCKKCGSMYATKKELRQHAQSHFYMNHNKLFKCALCEHSSSEQKTAIKHLEEHHSMVLETETVVFATFEEFQVWKRETELETSSLYVSYHGSYKTNEFVRFKYFCHRSGSVRRQGKGIRRIKASKKIDAFCPSRIEVMAKADKCEVVFVKTHVGHDHAETSNQDCDT